MARDAVARPITLRHESARPRHRRDRVCRRTTRFRRSSSADTAFGCLVRRPDAGARTISTWMSRSSRGDLLDPSTLGSGVGWTSTPAFYLVHALGSGGDLWQEETEAALELSRRAAEHARRSTHRLSRWARRRRRISRRTSRLGTRSGESFARMSVATLEFRASIILGSGQPCRSR